MAFHRLSESLTVLERLKPRRDRVCKKLGFGAIKRNSVCWLHKPSLATETLSTGACLATKRVKNPPAMQEPQEIQVRSLGQEGPLEEGLATHSSVLAWRIPWTTEPGGLWSMVQQRVRCGWSCTQARTSPLAQTRFPLDLDLAAFRNLTSISLIKNSNLPHATDLICDWENPLNSLSLKHGRLVIPSRRQCLKVVLAQIYKAFQKDRLKAK